VRTLQAHFYQSSEFKVGTVMGLGDIYPRMTASKQNSNNWGTWWSHGHWRLAFAATQYQTFL